MGPPAEVEAPLGSARHGTLPPGGRPPPDPESGLGRQRGLCSAGYRQPALCPLEMKGSGLRAGFSVQLWLLLPWCPGGGPKVRSLSEEVGMLGMHIPPGGGCVQGSHADWDGAFLALATGN